MSLNINLFSRRTKKAENADVQFLPLQHGFYRSRINAPNISINSLIAAAEPVLTLATILKETEYPEDRNKFLQDLMHEIRAFEHKAQIENYQTETVLAARYSLCCLLDEIIVQTDWGKKNGWLENNLLTMFYDEHNTKRFFTLIDRVQKNTAGNEHLIELLYLCMRLGFAGRNAEKKHSKNELDLITNNLYQIICQNRGASQQNLFVRDSKEKIEQMQKLEGVELVSISPIKTSRLLCITSAAALAVSGIFFASIHVQLRNISKPIYASIEQIAKKINTGVG